MMLDPVILAVYALAVARVTALVTTETITEDLRNRLIDWLDDRPRTIGAFVASLVTCPWCAGVWVAGGTAPLVWWHGANPVVLVPALALALAQAAGMVANVGR